MQLLADSLATVFGLGVLIVLLGPVSSARFNPVVTLAAWLTGRRDPGRLSLRDVAVYVPAQTARLTAGAPPLGDAAPDQAHAVLVTEEGADRLRRSITTHVAEHCSWPRCRA